MDLAKYLEKPIRVKFQGGREGKQLFYHHIMVMITFWCVNVDVLLTASGILKGFDPLLNLVLDNTIELLRGCLLLIIIFNSYHYFLIIRP